MDDAERRDEAVRKIKEKQRFKTSLITYLAVNAFLIVIWFMGDRGFFWPIWVIAGWGLGLVFQGWRAYGARPITEEDIRREIDGG